ncbi:nucleosome assembly protein 1-like 1 [Hydractinia symbiolongicarpus]|uniref:nucleosome assembly protein 1-like 1 n=1 Tax=Hydractinia symbiolongicarpus TaxID=13093 RepID=UPI00254AA4FB|nr:nucleosome assembly protein 1-like 1 [Hydractinia symbiolongicarpus]
MSGEPEAGGEHDVQIDSTTGLTASDLMSNPQIMAAVQAKLNGLMGVGTGFIETLPECVKRRINALKNIQVECAKLEGKFYEEAHLLEMKYAELFKPLYDKRNDIVNAVHEPNDEEATWVEPGEDNEEEEEEEKKKAEEEEKAKAVDENKEKTEEEKIAEDVLNKLKMDENTKGIPEFWLIAMKNVELLEEMIQEHDEEILKHLIDIKLIFTGKKDDGSSDDSEMGFVLEFQFSPNEYFTNTALTKTYKMKSEPDVDDPFSFEGPDIVSCTGCKIDWQKGKNITQKQVKKKQKHKGRGQTRVVTKTVQNDSFFNFFDPPEVPENVDEDDIDEETEAILAADFEIGHFFRERLIPKAVLFYTGEAIEEDSDDEDDELDDDEDDDDDDGDDDDENDPDFKPGEKPQECQQQ